MVEEVLIFQVGADQELDQEGGCPEGHVSELAVEGQRQAVHFRLPFGWACTGQVRILFLHCRSTVAVSHSAM
jgi:hypothetical protein